MFLTTVCLTVMHREVETCYTVRVQSVSQSAVTYGHAACAYKINYNSWEEHVNALFAQAPAVLHVCSFRFVVAATH